MEARRRFPSGHMSRPTVKLLAGWTMALDSDRDGIDGAQHFHADVYRFGEWVCRISLSGTFTNMAAAEAALGTRTQVWLEEHESQPDARDSGFQLL